MRFAPTGRNHILNLELTAMIDVIFLLIIFFMTTAQFVERARADLELPQEKGEAVVETAVPPLVVNILSDPEDPFVISEQRLSLRGAQEAIDREIARHVSAGRDIGLFEVVIRADERGASRHVNQIGAFMRERGVRRWRLATEPPR